MQAQHDGGDGSEALMWGASERVGWFRFFFDDDGGSGRRRSRTCTAIRRSRCTPTTELVLSHQHPEDYRQIADTLALIRQTRQAFSSATDP